MLEETGLERYSSAPRFNTFVITPEEAITDIIIIGILLNFLISEQTCQPSMLGISKSRIMRSGDARRVNSIPFSPELAVNMS